MQESLIPLIDYDVKDDVQNGKVKIVVREEHRNENKVIKKLYLSDGTLIASIVWMGTHINTGKKLLQPAIIGNEVTKSYISFDGRANYIGDSDLLALPDDGSYVPLDKNGMCYFNNSNPSCPNEHYNLDLNNKSIRMNNISIWNLDFSKGVMFDFRASMEGSFDSTLRNGCVVILAGIDTIDSVY